MVGTSSISLLFSFPPGCPFFSRGGRNFFPPFSSLPTRDKPFKCPRKKKEEEVKSPPLNSSPFPFPPPLHCGRWVGGKLNKEAVNNPKGGGGDGGRAGGREGGGGG